MYRKKVMEKIRGLNAVCMKIGSDLHDTSGYCNTFIVIVKSRAAEVPVWKS